jgi:hypothetical protein
MYAAMTWNNGAQDAGTIKDRGMNDFTKEELIDLEETYTWICEEYSQPDSDYVIRDKLREMIANFCDHASDGEVWFRKEGRPSDLIPQKFCKKCEEFYE